jgi:hypothetical protein
MEPCPFDGGSLMSLSEYVVASKFAQVDVAAGDTSVYELKRTFILHAKDCPTIADKELFTADRRGEGVLATLAVRGLGVGEGMERGNEWEPVWTACEACGTAQVPVVEWQTMARNNLTARGYDKFWTS